MFAFISILATVVLSHAAWRPRAQERRAITFDLVRLNGIRVGDLWTAPHASCDPVIVGGFLSIRDDDTWAVAFTRLYPCNPEGTSFASSGGAVRRTGGWLALESGNGIEAGRGRDSVRVRYARVQGDSLLVTDSDTLRPPTAVYVRRR